MNLAVVSPWPPQPSGIADYAVALLPFLRPYFDRVVAVADGFEPCIEAGLVDRVVNLHESASVLHDPEYVPLYHVGCNAQFHRYGAAALRRSPGFVVLHDGSLLPLIHELTVGAGDLAAFHREAAFEGGPRGLDDAWRALWLRETLGPADYGMLRRVGEASLGVIVHSRYLQRRVHAVAPSARVRVIPHLDLMHDGRDHVSGDVARAELGLDSGALLVGVVGMLAPSKQLGLLLRAFARLASDFPRVRVLCVGAPANGYSVGCEIALHGLEDRVAVTGWVGRGRFGSYLHALDIGVNLRHPTWGESSGALARLMGSGVATVVSNAGSYAELPDGVVIKVPAGCDCVLAVEGALRKLLERPELRREVGRAAREYVRANGHPRRVGARYVEFIYETISLGAGQLATRAMHLVPS